MFYLFKTRLSSRPDTFRLQITDLLQLSRKEQERRSHCLHAMQTLSDWKKSDGKISRNRTEGRILKKQVRYAILLYRIARKNRIEIFHQYLESLPVRSPAYGVAR